MSTESANIPGLLHGLVDDAGLFPPTALTMPEAVERHRRDQRAGEPMLTHRFLCPASRLGELRAELADADHIRLGLITDRGAEGLAEALGTVEEDPRLSLALLEMPLAAFGDRDESTGTAAALRAISEVPAEVPAFLEPPAVENIDAVLNALSGLPGSGRRVGGKLRCGGVRAELFPGPEQVVHFLAACVAAGIPLKATAGLHQAVRHTDAATGFTHHGYLNLLLATALTAGGTERSEVRAALELEDAGELARRIRGLHADEIRRARSVLVSYGSCSTSTPPAQAREILESTTERKVVQ